MRLEPLVRLSSNEKYMEKVFELTYIDDFDSSEVVLTFRVREEMYDFIGELSDGEQATVLVEEYPDV